MGSAERRRTTLRSNGLLFGVTFQLRHPLRPIFSFGILLRRLVAIFDHNGRALAWLLIGFRFLLRRQVDLGAHNFVQKSNFLHHFFNWDRTLTICHFLRRLWLILRADTIHHRMVALLLRNVLRSNIPFRTFALLIGLHVRRHLLNLRWRFLTKAWNYLTSVDPVRAATGLLRLLQDIVRHVLRTFKLHLWQGRLTIVEHRVILYILRVIRHLNGTDFRLTRQGHTRGFTHFFIIVSVTGYYWHHNHLTRFFQHFDSFLP